MENSIKDLEQKNARKVSKDFPLWLLILLFMIPVFIYLPGIFGKIPYPSESSLYTDLMLTHYPNALFLKKSIIEYQQIPLWSTMIHSGAPFAANPLAGLFYFPGWLALLFPLPEGISIGLALHAVFATWGMYFFLKNENVSDLGAIAGGLAFGLTPKIAAHYGAGHISMIYAISWTPWLFLVSKKDQLGWKTGITAALLFLADPRWAVYAGVFWFTYSIAYRQSDNHKTAILYYFRAGISALLIASPLIIPMYEYVGLSTRTRMGFEDIFAFSLSPDKLIGLIIPGNWGNPEWYFYSGGIVIGFFLIQLFIKEIRERNRFWIIWIIISILISFGSWFIDPDWISQIPIISLLRVPARALFILGFSFSVITGRTVEYLFAEFQNIKKINKVSFGIAIFSAALGISFGILLKDFSIAVIWGFAFLLILSLIVLVKKPGSYDKIWSWIMVGFLIFDLAGAGFQSYYLAENQRDAHVDILSEVNEEPESFRLYSPSFSIPQHFSAEVGIELADGVDPLQVAAYADFMEDATGIENSGYSVTIPPFESGNPGIDNVDSKPDAYLLSLINVKYVISEFKIENPDFIEVYNNGHKFVYRNSISSRRAWVEEEPKNGQYYQSMDIGKVNEISLTPNKVTLSASGPGNLVLSEIDYPGWRVFVDGEKKPLEKAYGVLRSVHLPVGEHKIEFSFQPPTVYVGIGMAIIGWILVFWQIYRYKDDDGISH